MTYKYQRLLSTTKMSKLLQQTAGAYQTHLRREVHFRCLLFDTYSITLRWASADTGVRVHDDDRHTFEESCDLENDESAILLGYSGSLNHFT